MTASMTTLEKPPLFEGDIAGFLDPGLRFANMAEEEALLDNALRNGILLGRWVDGKMPYVLSDKFTGAERTLVLNAVKEINDNAKHFKIVQRNGEDNYVSIVRGGPNTGCYSYGVGNMQHGPQIVTLQARINFSDDRFLHKQARTDRNDYVEINWSNIPQDHHIQFAHYDASFIDITAFGQPYDYVSVMHRGYALRKIRFCH